MPLELKKEHACFGGVQSYYTHESTECGPMSLAVFRPKQAVDGAPCPVVLYLSGLTCSEENVTAKAGAQRVCAELGALFVAPDTSPRGAGYPGEEDDWDFGTGAGFYVDATREPWSARYRMYSYVTGELRALIDAELPTRPDAWSITGHSMGGHGALVIGLREPDRWRRVSALAPIGSPAQVPWGEKAFSGYLGDDREAWKAYDASELVKERPRPDALLVNQGTADPFLDEQLRPELFSAACEDAGQKLELNMRDDYDHSYFFVASFIEDHIRFLLAE